ncbi:MAG: LamG domain protein jellyroll fold domain protein [Candidatus Berkelbacteria bacterium Licking1014_7]|uniref:LamG domain protein jellyroll fold domain protein n=1 Tax=Candidatus Berkelbacteria bacterium Licking1014_7 TaxID=2017147 RepID=A0A554LJY5_9BACT|nr:MAG: LamG domain protein jellyroll fold domain protein [Candidatus Berkelbacteria bacterium Licking1014_7]
MKNFNKKLILFILALFVLSTVGFGVQQIYASFLRVSNLNKGLVGQWDLSKESMKSATVFGDRTPYGNNGTSANTPTLTTDQKGQANKALSFNGTSDYVGTGTKVLSSFTAITVSAWVKFNTTANYDGWVNQWGSGVYNGYAHRISDSAPYKQYFEVSINDENHAIGATTLSTGTWYHLVGTWTSGDNVRVYLNGTLDGTSATVKTGTITPNKNFGIGFLQWSGANPANYHNGSINDVRIYNRALTQTEITQLYNQYAPKLQVNSLSKGLVGQWKLSQASKKGTLYGDSTPYSNDGTPVGTTPTTDRHGQSNMALSFNGTSDWVDLGNFLTNWQPQSIYTLSVWFKTTLSGTNQAVFGNLQSGAHGYIIRMQNESISYTVYGSGVNGVSASANWVNIPDSNWNHLVVIGNNKVFSFYLNGNLVPITSNNLVDASYTVGATQSTRIGDAWVFKFTGSISDVRIYNRALSAAEILQLYNLY